MSIRIINQKSELDKVTQYLMTTSPNIKSMKDVKDGTSIPVTSWLTFEDTKQDGSTEIITSIITPNKEVYAFQSDTFRRSLMDIDEIMGDDVYHIIKTSGKTKADRPYINCYLDVESLGHN